MRALALLVLLVSPVALSGCLEGIFIGPEPAHEATSSGTTTVSLAPPRLGSSTGALGLWVPPGALALRVFPGDSNASEDADSPAMNDPLLAHLPDLLAILDPAGRWVSATVGDFDPGFIEDDDYDDYDFPFPAIDPPVFAIPHPTPGLYRILLYGGHAAPRAELDVPAGTPVAAMAPLPLAMERRILDEGFGRRASLDAGGDLPLANGTAIVWPEARGVAGQVRIAILNGEGDPVIEDNRLYTASAPGAPEFFPLFPEPFFGGGPNWHPEALAVAPFSWESEGTGSALILAYIGVVAELAAPYARADGRGASPEQVTLQGSIDPWTGAGFTMPGGGALALQVDAESGAETARFRVYDMTGRRLAWGATDDAGTQPIPLLAGALAIINDGPGHLVASIVGAAPADAALHELELASTEATATLEGVDRPDQATHRVTVPGPILDLYSQSMGPVTDLFVHVERTDGTLLATSPDLSSFYPGEGGCCNFPFFGGAPASGHFLDPGTYNLRFSATAGSGDVRATITYALLSSS